MGQAIGRIEILPDPLALAHHVAKWMTQAALAAEGSFRVSLSGGSTPKTLYGLLASDEFRDRTLVQHRLSRQQRGGMTIGTEADRRVAAVSHGRPEVRITMTYPAIESSRRVAFLVAGEEKAAVFSTIRAGNSQVPAARVQPVGELFWFVDQAAAGEG